MALIEQNKQLYNKTIKKVNISEFIYLNLKIHVYKNESFYSICKRLLQHLKDEQIRNECIPTLTYSKINNNNIQYKNNPLHNNDRR